MRGLDARVALAMGRVMEAIDLDVSDRFYMTAGALAQQDGYEDFEQQNPIPYLIADDDGLLEAWLRGADRALEVAQARSVGNRVSSSKPSFDLPACALPRFESALMLTGLSASAA